MHGHRLDTKTGSLCISQPLMNKIFTGEIIEVNVTRSLPAYGNVGLMWSISGMKDNILEVGFAVINGSLVFEEVSIET